MLKNSNLGISIIEALVSVAIFSVAMLGAAKFQIESTKNQSSAHLQTLATNQAFDMLDRIKANLAGFSASAYDNPFEKYHASCLSSGCSSSEMAEFDYYEWQQNNLAFLPEGNGTVSTSGDNATIALNWMAHGEAKSYRITMRMT